MQQQLYHATFLVVCVFIELLLLSASLCSLEVVAADRMAEDRKCRNMFHETVTTTQETFKSFVSLFLLDSDYFLPIQSEMICLKITQVQ